jgi:Flp pilus assembly protein TadG
MIRRLAARLRRDERGDGDVAALMFLAPAAFGVVLLFVFVGRQGASVESVTHASQVAARSASLERSQQAAQAAGTSSATATLSAAGTACDGGPTVSVTADAWAPGETIEVTVTCRVATDDLGAIHAPGRSFTAMSRALIDTYRGFEP